jgi:hypothetical protein
MTNKNPFEIRMDVLNMAKDYLDRQFEVQMDFYQKAFDVATNNGTATLDVWKSLQPQMYTAEELQKKAQEFYKFVSDKS